MASSSMASTSRVLIPLAHQLNEVLFLFRHTINSVALCLEVLQHLVDAAKHIQVGSSAHIALVRWEAEDCDGHLLLGNLLLGKAAAEARHEQRWRADRACVLCSSCMPTAACWRDSCERTQQSIRSTPVCLLPNEHSACRNSPNKQLYVTCSKGHAQYVRPGEGKGQEDRAEQEGRAGQKGLLGPLDGSAAEHIDTVRQGVALASVAVPSSKHNGLDPTIKLRQCHLHHQTVTQGDVWASKVAVGVGAGALGAIRQKLLLSAASNMVVSDTISTSMQ